MKVFAGKKALIIVQNLPVPFDRRVWLEAKTLSRNGCKVSVISPKSKEFTQSFEIIEDISVYRYHMPINAFGAMGYIAEFFYAWLATAFLSVKVLLRDGFDVIHACNPPDTYFLLGLFYRLLGKRYIFDHHDLSPEMYSAKYPETPSRWLLAGLYLLEKMTFWTADVVMSTNESYKEIAITRGGKDESRVYVVRTGPDLNRLKILPQKPELKQGKRFMVSYLGEMCPQDGIEYLLRSITFYVNELGRKDTLFLLIGGGPAYPAFKRMSEEMGLGEYVKFTGRISDDDLNEYLSTADVCVDPDPYSEWADHSTMNKILEYMSFAKPVVTYDLVEARRSAGDAAVYVMPNNIKDFAQAISDLIDDPDKRSVMGKIGRSRILNSLSWEHSQKNLIAAYDLAFYSRNNKVQDDVKLLSKVQ